METKFKFNDKVRLISNPEIEGECVDIIPHGIFNGKPFYSYKVHNIRLGMIQVAEDNMELIE